LEKGITVRKFVRVRKNVRKKLRMATVNYYLDKEDRKGFSPIHLRINCNGEQIKVSTKEKVSSKEFDKKTQLIKPSSDRHGQINHYLINLKDRAKSFMDNPSKKTFSEKEIKAYLNNYIERYDRHKVNVVAELIEPKGDPVTFVDLFAGAGGFSEGFLQAETKKYFYDFVVANDINENCELTHVVRYNHQLGLDAGFLCQDITEPDFLDNLLEKIGDKKIDVVCGGPPCQSFSLAGKRKKFDKKDDLFSHYLEVIKVLRPKYFVMENVKGILTKEKGKIKEVILKEINSIIDIKEIPKLVKFVKEIAKSKSSESFLFECILRRVEIERKPEESEKNVATYIDFIGGKFKKVTTESLDYQTSRTDVNVSTIRHGFNLLLRSKQWEKLKRDIIKEKDHCNIDNDVFAQGFTDFINDLDPEVVIVKIENAFRRLALPKKNHKLRNDIIKALSILNMGFDDVVSSIKDLCNKKQLAALDLIIDEIRLYKIKAPFVANASNYGVPQNRERVLFIGCRKDQEFISEIPATVKESEKVTVFEALHDLDFIGNDEEARLYKKVDIKKQFNGQASYFKSLLNERSIDGKPTKKNHTYAKWSKGGRLVERFANALPPFYVKNYQALHDDEKVFDELHNHKTSKQSKDVVKRLDIIRKKGDYKEAQVELNACGLSSKKRNYSVLKPNGQSPTVLTIPDDYIHYNSPRALTVREMARLQSFDDSFVFQGKRSTGGNNRKTEVPQYTLVGNAVPPLLARAVASEILKYIK
jgi:DNA (cytosine-5)-methyltransferase 1